MQLKHRVRLFPLDLFSPIALALLILGAFSMGGCHSGDDGVEAGGVAAAWVVVDVDETACPEARCGDGSPYRWAYREGSGDGLLLFFQGDGACFTRRSCWDNVMSFDGGGRLVYSMDNTTPLPPDLDDYIFDQTDPANPFRTYDVVYLPYCTGDMGVGTTCRSWWFKGETRETYFHGAANVNAVLDWTRERYPTPSKLVIAGTSAGGYAAMSAMERILEDYPAGEILYVTDGALGIQPPIIISVGESAWKPAWPAFCLDAQGRNRCESLGAAIDLGLSLYPRVRAAQLSMQQDFIQSSFALAVQREGLEPDGLRQLFDMPPFDEQLIETVLARQAVCDTCRFFLPTGGCHVFLQSPLWTEAEIDGWVPRDWVAAFIEENAPSLFGEDPVRPEPYPVNPDQEWIPCHCPDGTGACLGADVL